MEERIGALEDLAKTQGDFNRNIATMLQSQEGINHSVVTMLQSQEEVNRNVLTMLQSQDEVNRTLLTMLRSHEEAMAEMREDHRKTQRLWVKLAQKYGWLEDIDPSEDMP